MAIQYTIYYEDTQESPTTESGATLGIALALSATDVFYGTYNSKTISEIHLIYSGTSTGDFTLTGTAAATGPNPTIRSVDFTVGSPAPGGGHFRWVEASNVLTLTFEAPALAASLALWEFGRFTSPPTKLKVVVKRQSDPV